MKADEEHPSNVEGKTCEDGEECSTCEGNGYVMIKCCYPMPLSRIECACGYGGGFIDEICEECDGKGYECNCERHCDDCIEHADEITPATRTVNDRDYCENCYEVAVEEGDFDD